MVRLPAHAGCITHIPHLPQLVPGSLDQTMALSEADPKSRHHRT